jgi:hypothetical protein
MRTGGSFIVDGSLGVGTTTPTEKLEVQGNVLVNGSLKNISIQTGTIETDVLVINSDGTIRKRSDLSLQGPKGDNSTASFLEPSEPIPGNLWLDLNLGALWAYFNEQ